MKQPLTFLGVLFVFLLALVCSFFATVLFSEGAEVSTTFTQSYFSDKDLEPARGIILEVKKESLPVFVSFSYEDLLLRLCGQETADISLIGVGIGFQYPYEFLTFSLGASYYFPDVSNRKAFREGMMLKINHMYPEGKRIYSSPDVYTYEVHGNIGAWFKVNVSYPVSEHVSFQFGAGYRYLNLEEHYVRDHRNYIPGSWVEFVEYRDLSGGFGFVGLTWSF
ncbi:hypothetical protein ES703_10226 [subsurface metagenome]